ncbi:hypothetical protein Ahy_A08g040369 [Arachis hypogaea]|uniref:Uncharacterized protein n=1 Tax=Arachis hypogaea TaxID=3818 RepID=A0A445BYZ8_ARAHY|nr:hypothetical protein Ahy_A08g040369 [Arachis hypogaea]
MAPTIVIVEECSPVACFSLASCCFHHLLPSSLATVNCSANLPPSSRIVDVLMCEGIISKVVLNYLHAYCPNEAEIIKQHRQLSMFDLRTIQNNNEADIRLSKTYQYFVAAA